jgi:crotonobetainyl-CoA:carnitine CoA-transferase CaiB-like acyl-CoA transferase
MMLLPFSALRVLDMSQGYAGPYCGMLLGQHGAQVTKVEPPEGDWIRGMGTRQGEHTALDLAVNRGKRSIAIDMRAKAGRALARRLAGGYDVFIESFRPGVADKLGLGYAALAAANPELVHLSINGFGPTGPDAARPDTDTVLQAFSGMMALNRDAAGNPSPVGFLIVDALSALYAFQAPSVALYARLAGGGGRHLEISLMQSCAAFLAPKIIESRLDPGGARSLNAPAGIYRSSDGWIALALSKEAQFRSLAAAIGRADLLADPRFDSFETRARHLPALLPAIEQALLGTTTAEWLQRFATADELCSRVNGIAEWLAEPQVQVQVQAMGAVAEAPAPMGAIPLPLIPGAGAPHGDWPAIGGDGAQVLRAAGLSEPEIDALVAAGTVVLPHSPARETARH